MKSIASIQILRAIAAIAVTAFHFQFDLWKLTGAQTGLLDLHLGAAGVDLFFVISGFVMVYATEPQFTRLDGPSIFLTHRVIRIVPIYWLVTAIYLLMGIAIPAFGRGYSIAFVAASLFFIPYQKSGNDVEPIVGQGWTLNYEMFFYVIFAFTVAFPRSIAVAIASSVLVSAVIAGQLFAPLPVIFAFWSDPIIIEFVFGMLLALAYRRGIRISKVAGFGLISVGPLLFFVFARYAPPDLALRVITWGIPAALLVAGATLRSFNLTSSVWRGFATIGDASYALYLFHSFSNRGVLYFARWLGFDLVKTAWPLLAVAVVLAVVLALAIHNMIERPVTKRLRYWMAISSTPTSGAREESVSFHNRAGS